VLRSLGMPHGNELGCRRRCETCRDSTHNNQNLGYLLVSHESPRSFSWTGEQNRHSKSCPEGVPYLLAPYPHIHIRSLFGLLGGREKPNWAYAPTMVCGVLAVSVTAERIPSPSMLTT
jgi:hypothetical protein